MRTGHQKAQAMFQALGAALGYVTARTWSRALPTDGVWLSQTDNGGLGILPIAALEVVVSEGVKQMRGSIATLMEVSPAVGVIVLQDHEIRRGCIRDGMSADAVQRLIAHRTCWLANEVRAKSQRIVVWAFDELAARCRFATARRTQLLKAA